MIEVGKCYKVVEKNVTAYIKVLDVKKNYHKVKSIFMYNSYTAKISYYTILEPYRDYIEIPESEYKAKLAEVKQILEEMEK